MKNIAKINKENEMKMAKYKGITLQEFDFLRSFADLESPLFGNAYQSAIKAGYSESYARVIRRHYSTWRRKLLKNASKNEGLMRIIEATRDIDLGAPIIDEQKLKRIIRKNDKELHGMTANEVISELDNLLRWGI